MNDNEHKRKLTTSRDILLNVALNPHNQKFFSLPQHEVLRAKIFRSENNNKQKKFMRYKRGTIVFIHFGINTGTEFSNSHFGIVLDKDDHPNQGKLTILPLTSKSGKQNISIGKAIFSGIMNDAEKQVKKMQEILNMTFDLERLHYSLPKPPSHFHMKENHPNYKDWHEYYNRHDPDGKHIPVANVTIKQWIQSDLDKINHLKKLYRNYNKVSYAKIDSITSVSKLKVAKPINDLDPVGRIQLSKETMDEIDQALARKLLSGPWRRIDRQTE